MILWFASWTKGTVPNECIWLLGYPGRFQRLAQFAVRHLVFQFHFRLRALSNSSFSRIARRTSSVNGFCILGDLLLPFRIHPPKNVPSANVIRPQTITYRRQLKCGIISLAPPSRDKPEDHAEAEVNQSYQARQRYAVKGHRITSANQQYS